MALISSFSRCAICHKLLDDLPYLATSAVAYPFCDDDPLYPLYDTPLHWDCYEPWPARPRFARQYVSAVAENDSRNPYCGEALRTNLMYLSVHLRFRRYGEPPRKEKPEEAWVWLLETGTCVRVPLSKWAAWLWDLGVTDATAGSTRRPPHRLELASLWKVLPELRRLFPNPEAVLAAVDWKAKERLAEAIQKEAALRERARLDANREHNNACRDFAMASGHRGLTCPHCRRQSTDIEFVDYADDDRKAYFVCPACGRSFGHDL